MNANEVLIYTTEKNTSRYNHLIGCYNLALDLLKDITLPTTVKDKILNTVLLHDIGYSDKLKCTGLHSIDGYNFLNKNHPDLCFHKAIYLHSDFVNICPDRYKAQSDEIFNSLSDLEFATLLLLDYCDCHIDGQGNEVTISGRWMDLESRYQNNATVLHNSLSTKEYAYHVERIIDRILDILPTLK